MSLGIQLCPKCSAEVDVSQGFGMTACASCGEIIMIGQGEMPAYADPQKTQAPVIDEIQELPTLQPMTSFGSADIPVQEPMFESPIREMPTTQTKAPIDNFSFKEVEAFGNSPGVAPGVGGLVYNLRIEGIDTAEDRKLLADCLVDRRLGVNSDELMDSIKGGVLELNQWHPLKASVFINRIKHMPFEVSWTCEQILKSLFFVLILAGSTGTEAREWGQHEINLAGMTTKMKIAQEELKTLIQQKNSTKDPKVREDLLSKIVKRHKEMVGLYMDLKKEEEHIRFEHPEKGDKALRKYKRVKDKSLEELEDELGIDGQLSRLKRKVDDTYPK